MQIRKIKTPAGNVKWELYGRIGGRGSKQVRKRFNKRIEAETWRQRKENKETEEFIKEVDLSLKKRTLF